MIHWIRLIVEDDGIGGYNDNGMDDWGQDDHLSEDEAQKKRKYMRVVASFEFTQI